APEQDPAEYVVALDGGPAGDITPRDGEGGIARQRASCVIELEWMGVQRFRSRGAGYAQERALPPGRRSRVAQRPVRLGQPQIEVGMGVGGDLSEQPCGFAPVAACVGEIAKALQGRAVARLGF